jgi:hypothetical protein
LIPIEHASANRRTPMNQTSTNKGILNVDTT